MQFAHSKSYMTGSPQAERPPRSFDQIQDYYVDRWRLADLRAIPTIMHLARAAINGQAPTTIARSESIAALSAAHFWKSATFPDSFAVVSSPVSPIRRIGKTRFF